MINGEATSAGLLKVCDYVEQGSKVGVLRGDDSTGMFQVDRKGVVHVHKLAMRGEQFAETKRAKRMFSAADSSVATILHHRAATRGIVSYENSHPFEHSDKERYLVGVHNGSLMGTPYTYDGLEFNVDSDYAMYRLFKEREEAFKHFNGAYAFVWYENDGKIRIACNGERAFSFAFIHKKNAMLIASEANMLWWLAARNELELDDILAPESHRMLTFDPSSELRAFTDVKIDKYTAPVHVPYVHNRGGHGQNFHQAGGTTQQLTVFSAKDQDNVGLDVTVSGSGMFRPGQDIEFYPEADKCSVQQFGGTVIEEVQGRGPVVIPAILSPGNAKMLDNIKANLTDFIVCKVRSVTKKQGEPDVLLLDSPELAVARSRENLLDFIEGPGRLPLTRTEFKEMTKNGCALCSSSISVQDGIDGCIGWNTTSQEPICTACIAELSEAGAGL